MLFAASGVCWRAGIIKAVANSVPKSCKGNVSTLFDETAIVAMGNERMKAFVLSADSHMQTARQVLEQETWPGLDANFRAKTLGNLDIRMVGHVSNRDTGLGKFKSLREIGYQFWQELEKKQLKRAALLTISVSTNGCRL